ncbi:MAG: hypothetical protein LBF71_03230 [Campylobacteraceae bacterium]|nr:hypothetical protein [Campylobacteraceae bacterium]
MIKHSPKLGSVEEMIDWVENTDDEGSRENRIAYCYRHYPQAAKEAYPEYSKEKAEGSPTEEVNDPIKEALLNLFNPIREALEPYTDKDPALWGRSEYKLLKKEYEGDYPFNLEIIKDVYKAIKKSGHEYLNTLRILNECYRGQETNYYYEILLLCEIIKTNMLMAEKHGIKFDKNYTRQRAFIQKQFKKLTTKKIKRDSNYARTKRNRRTLSKKLKDFMWLDTLSIPKPPTVWLASLIQNAVCEIVTSGMVSGLYYGRKPTFVSKECYEKYNFGRIIEAISADIEIEQWLKNTSSKQIKALNDEITLQIVRRHYKNNAHKIINELKK